MFRLRGDDSVYLEVELRQYLCVRRGAVWGVNLSAAHAFVTASLSKFVCLAGSRGKVSISTLSI